jgi:FRG domain-containing protein
MASLEKPLPYANEQSDPPAQESGDDRLITPQTEASLRRLGELYNTPLDSYAEIHSFAHASDLFSFLQTWPLADQCWAFRGQENERWTLEPSLERLAHCYKDITADDEMYALRAFKRRAHHYLRDLPGKRDELEWLALLRHHGAPTRLLDWTRSPYVAAFFATAEANDKYNSAIWAIDIDAI